MMFQVRLRNIPPRARRDKKISDTHGIGWWANPKHDTDDNHSSNLFFFFLSKILTLIFEIQKKKFPQFITMIVLKRWVRVVAGVSNDKMCTNVYPRLILKLRVLLAQPSTMNRERTLGLRQLAANVLSCRHRRTIKRPDAKYIRLVEE